MTSKIQPWKAVFDYSNSNVKLDASQPRNEVRGFKKGEPIIIGGQTPEPESGDVIYDTGVKQDKKDKKDKTES